MVQFGPVEISLTYKHIICLTPVLSLSDNSCYFLSMIWSRQGYAPLYRTPAWVAVHLPFKACLSPTPWCLCVLWLLTIAESVLGSWHCFLGNARMPRVTLILACGAAQAFCRITVCVTQSDIAMKGQKGWWIGGQRWPPLTRKNWMLLCRANACLCSGV